MKKIWLINHYAMPPELEPRIRTIKFAQFLTKKGFDVTIIGASSMHNMSFNLIEGNEEYIVRYYNNIKFIHIKARDYKGYVSRVSNLIEFPIRLIKNAPKFEKPDIILHTATVPFSNILYFLAKKLKAQYIVEVLDLWPESFYMTGIISGKNPIMPILYATEKWLYKKAEKLIFSMEGGKDYILEKKWDIDHVGPIDINKVAYINNGVDLQEFDKFKEQYSFFDADLNDNTTFKVVYIGAIRLFNNVKLLIEAAELLKNNKKIKILIYGDGNERENLEEYVRTHNLDNVIFKEKYVEKQYIPYIVSNSCLNVINYQQNGIWKYGGSQNKMFQYLASGKPIISNIEANYCLIKKYKCGVSRVFNNAKEYADAIEGIATLSNEDYKKMCQNALNGVKEFDYEKLTEKLIKLFDDSAVKKNKKV